MLKGLAEQLQVNIHIISSKTPYIFIYESFLQILLVTHTWVLYGNIIL